MKLRQCNITEISRNTSQLWQSLLWLLMSTSSNVNDSFYLTDGTQSWCFDALYPVNKNLHKCQQEKNQICFPAG